MSTGMNGPRIDGATSAATFQNIGNDESVATMDAPKPGKTPENLAAAITRPKSPAVNADIAARTERSIDANAALTPPRATPEQDAPAVGPAREFRDIRFDDRLSPNEKIAAITEKSVSSSDRALRDATVKNILLDTITRAVSQRMAGVNVSSPEGMANSDRISGEYNAVLHSLNVVLESDSSDEIHAATAELCDKLAVLMKEVPEGPEKNAALEAINRFLEIGAARQTLVEATSRELPSLETVMENDSPTVRNLTDFAQTMIRLDAMTRSDGGAGAELPLVKDNRLDDICENMECLAGTIQEEALKGNVDVLSGGNVDSPEAAKTFSKAEDAIRGKIGDGHADSFKASMQSIAESQATSTVDSVKVDACIRRLEAVGKGATGTAEDLEALRAALAEARGRFTIPTEKRAELEAAVKTAETLESRITDTFEHKSLAELDRALADTFAKGLDKANELLQMGGLRDEFRATIVEKVGNALKTRNEAALNDVEALSAELRELVKLYEGADAQKASSADRAKIGERIENLSARIDAALEQVEADLAHVDDKGDATGMLGDRAGTIKSGLEAIRDNVEKVGREELQTARDALAIMRSIQKIDYRVSIGMALNKGIAEQVRLLQENTLPEEKLRILLEHLRADDPPRTPMLSMAERMELGKQLALVLTNSHMAQDPLRTAMDRLKQGAALTPKDKTALLAAANQIPSREATEEFIVKKTEELSAKNLEMYQNQLATLCEKTQQSAARLAAGGKENDDDLKIVATFGEKREAILRQADLTLTTEDREKLSAANREATAAVTDGIVDAIHLGEERKSLSDNQKIFVRNVLTNTGFDIKLVRILTRSLDLFNEVMKEAAKPDIAARANAWDKLLGDHPDLDEKCLTLKSMTYDAATGMFAVEGDANAQRRIEQEHDGDRLIRACKAQMLNASFISPASKTARDELVAIQDNRQFLKRMAQGFGIAPQVDLFVIEAMWLLHCADMPGDIPDNEFAAFQAGLPEPYNTRETLRHEIDRGLMSTREMDACQEMVGDFSSTFDRSRTGHRFLSTVGSILNQAFTRAELVDKLLSAISQPPHHRDAEVVQRSLISAPVSNQQVMLANDSANMARMLPNGGKAGLSLGEKFSRFFHRISKSVKFDNLAEQLNKVRYRCNLAGIAAGFDPMSAVLELEGQHLLALEAVLSEVTSGEPGKFKSGVNMSARVIALDVAINKTSTTSTWTERRANAKSIRPLEGNANILSMEEGKGVKFKNSTAAVATSRFNEALSALQNAETREEYEAAEKQMREVMNAYHLVDRAKAVLVYAPDKKGPLDDKKLGKNVLKSPNATFLQAVKNETGGIYKAMLVATKSVEDKRKASRVGKNRSPSYYMSKAVSKAVRDACTVALLEQFRAHHPPTGFADFVDAFASGSKDCGFNAAVKEMAAAMREATHKQVTLNNARALAAAFLKETAQAFINAKGGPEKRLEEMAAEVRDPDNMRYLEKQMKDNKDAALAIRSGLRRLKLDDMFAKLPKRGMVTMNTATGVAVKYEFLNFSAAIDNGIAVARGADGKCSLMLSRGMTAGLSAEVDAAAGMLTASVSLEGNLSWGYQFDFPDEKACKEFLAKLLAGETPDVKGENGPALSLLTSQGVKLEAKASLDIGDKVDQVTGNLNTLNEIVDVEKRRVGVDSHRAMDLELGGQISSTYDHESKQHGRETVITHRVDFGASVNARLEVGRDGAIFKDEKSAEKRFTAELKAVVSEGKLKSATMIRKFTISKDATEEEVAGILAGFGQVNSGVVSFIMGKLAKGQGVTLSIDAVMNAHSRSKFERLPSTGAEGFARRSIFMCDRRNYDVTALRVGVDEREISRAKEYEKEAKDGEDDSGNSEIDRGTLKGKVEGFKSDIGDKVDELKDRAKAKGVDAANQLVDRVVKNETVNAAAKGAIGNLAADSEPGIFDKISVKATINADGTASRDYAFVILPAV